MHTDEAFSIYRTVAEWLVPPFLGFAIHYMQKISARLSEISESLAIVVTEIKSLDRRITRLEEERGRRGGL